MPINLLYTLLLLMVVLYWLTVILGALDLSSFDLDLDVDVDVDVDADVDIDADAGGHEIGWIAATLHFFNFGKMPFMVVMTVTVIAGWILTILSNYYIGNGSMLFAILFFLPILLVSLFAAKLFTAPLIPVFKRLDTTAEEIDYIGMACRLKLPASANKFGQAEVLIDGVPNLINVKTEAEAIQINSGEEALIIGQTDDERYYIVEKLT